MSIQWLLDVIEDRKNNPSEKSYTSSLFKGGLPRIAQKVGEEGTEVVVAALSQNMTVSLRKWQISHITRLSCFRRVVLT
jgi:phosphoribosyl-ATP pyrophosphohydrolase/phosphoribosyl-AMP cyclohydrolase